MVISIACRGQALAQSLACIQAWKYWFICLVSLVWVLSSIEALISWFIPMRALYLTSPRPFFGAMFLYYLSQLSLFWIFWVDGSQKAQSPLHSTSPSCTLDKTYHDLVGTVFTLVDDGWFGDSTVLCLHSAPIWCLVSLFLSTNHGRLCPWWHQVLAMKGYIFHFLYHIGLAFDNRGCLFYGFLVFNTMNPSSSDCWIFIIHICTIP